MMKSASFLLAAAVALMPTTAPAWIASNGLVVSAESETDFSIPYRGLSGARAFWCAAGDYVVRDLNLSGTTTIYRTSAPPRRSGAGMEFSLSPDRATDTGLLLLGQSTGLSASAARQMCDDRLLRF